jgi:undecaprenyl-phosphate 4-deoxy-4-formamido-L-arabinose transferase
MLYLKERFRKMQGIWKEQRRFEGMSVIDVSVVIPCYNSEKSIGEVVERVSEKLSEMGYSYEMILVNDHSADNTFQEIRRLAGQYSFIKGIDLAKNFGQHNAILAGFHYVSGEYVIGMDDDLQTDPSQFPKLFDKMAEGFDLVYGSYSLVHQSLFRRLGSRFNNIVLGKMIKQPKGIRTSSFWLAKSYVVKEVVKYEHSYANLRGLFFRTTAYIASTEVEHFDRKYGKSNYSFGRLLKLWSHCINFSVAPLRVFLLIGGLASAGGIIGGIVLIIRKLMNVNMSIGWPSLMTAILIFSGIILIGIGLTGEYIGRAFMCINATPQYVVRTVINAGETDEK